MGDSDSDVDFNPGPPANGEDMEIAGVSRGELDYLASKGVVRGRASPGCIRETFGSKLTDREY